MIPLCGNGNGRVSGRRELAVPQIFRAPKIHDGRGAAATATPSEPTNPAQAVLKSSRFTPIEARIGATEHCKQVCVVVCRPELKTAHRILGKMVPAGKEE